MKTLVAVGVIALIHSSLATLLIRVATDPVLEGEPVSLECLLEDSEHNISDVRFQIYQSYRNVWSDVRERYNYDDEYGRYRADDGYGRYAWCEYGRTPVTRTEDRAIMTISYASTYPKNYRCVVNGTNTTAPEASESVNYTAHYLREPQLTRGRFSRYIPFPQTLAVRAGATVEVNCSVTSDDEPDIFWYKEGSDWILPSSVLTLEKVSQDDSGQYTCSAVHPSIPSLNKTRSFNIIVLAEQAPWYQTSDGWVLICSVSSAAAVLLVMSFVTIFLCRRAKRTSSSRGPIDDRSQKKPIYKSSTESMPITSGDDRQPLV